MASASPTYVTTTKLPDGSGYIGSLWRRSDDALIYRTPHGAKTRAIARRVARAAGWLPKSLQVQK